MTLKNIRRLLPYLLLIAIYFFFINLEAKKTRNDIRNNANKNKIYEYNSNSIDNEMRITIPVIPYEK